MALVFQDGFEGWGVDAAARTVMVQSSNGWVNAQQAAITTGGARTGTYACKISATNNFFGPKCSLGSAKNAASGYFGVGFAVNLGMLPLSATRPICEFHDSLGSIQWSFTVSSTGVLSFMRGNWAGVVLGSTAAGAMSPNVYYHFELKCKMPTTVNSTDGELYLRVNGLPALTVTGTDMWNTGTIQTMELFVLNPLDQSWNTGDAWYDDVYVWDSTGSYCNDWIGNKAVYTYFPDADTATADWSITGVTQGFDAINDPAIDSDTTYIAATAVNHTSNFEVPTVLSTLTGIKALTLQTAMRQDSAGVSEVQASLLSGVTYATGTSRVAPFPGSTSSVYTAYQDHFYVDPADGASSLTPTSISAMQVRLKRTV